MKCRSCGGERLSEPYDIAPGSSLKGYICKDCNAITILEPYQLINLGHVVQAIRRPLIIIPTTDPHPIHKWRSWVDMDNPSVIHLGSPEDLAHELVHVLDFCLGTENAEKIIGAIHEDEYGYEEEDFADIMTPHFAESRISDRGRWNNAGNSS